MKILIQPLSPAPNSPWQVRIDQHSVRFSSETEARRFVATLEARLQAPHPWPSPRREAG
ncbi:hypothetical protein [Pseudomonas sp. PIC25]|uniref:hypothetical protein n=1 Tax=Pseudomonas sp. PIC25 TaxID=1958773 RepID=UPI00143D93C1|nr:hypothetical protein [Pseudomonas sp. PIC25]